MMEKMEIKILKLCDEEPGSVEDISKEAGFSVYQTREILMKLMKRGLVYLDKEIKKGLWCTTLHGSHELDRVSKNKVLNL